LDQAEIRKMCAGELTPTSIDLAGVPVPAASAVYSLRPNRKIDTRCSEDRNGLLY
jgi:hypothetical protein